MLIMDTDDHGIPYPILDDAVRRIDKSSGLTSSERMLEDLCEKTFLSLWSFPRPFSDRNKKAEDKAGKEVWELIVVFGDDVLLFSDKTCAFNDSVDVSTAWHRWYRAAIEDSAKQLLGARRWIREHPRRVFLDAACKRVFPHDLSAPELRFHMIAVTSGASAACRLWFGGGSGSLPVLLPFAVAPSTNTAARQERPVRDSFVIGNPGGDAGFVHVFDDVTLPIVLRELDTVRDFVDYLRAKETLAGRDAGLRFAGEEELLSVYVSAASGTLKPRFPNFPSDKTIVLGEGGWDLHKTSDLYRRRRRLVHKSKVWDALIELLNKSLLDGRILSFGEPQGFRPHERRIRALASVDRATRSMFADALMGLVHAGRVGQVLCRLVPSADWSIALFLVRYPVDVADERQYRADRAHWLHMHTLRKLGSEPRLGAIVGLAIGEDANEFGASEELIYFEQAELTAEERELAAEVETAAKETRVWASTTSKLGRNARCPCGSGAKFKRCHGR
jgi:uncharacterized protein YchJ